MKDYTCSCSWDRVCDGCQAAAVRRASPMPGAAPASAHAVVTFNIAPHGWQADVDGAPTICRSWADDGASAARLLSTLSRMARTGEDPRDAAIVECWSVVKNTPAGPNGQRGLVEAMRRVHELRVAAGSEPIDDGRVPVGHWRTELDRLRTENEALRAEKAERHQAAVDAVRAADSSGAAPSDRLRKAAQAVWDAATGTGDPGIYAVRANLLRDLDWALRAAPFTRDPQVKP